MEGPSEVFGLFDTVLSGPAAAPYAVGWALLAVGVAFSLALDQLRLTQGEGAQAGAILGRAFLAACGLGLYTFIAQTTWVAGQSLAYDIFPDTKMAILGKLMSQVSSRFQDYSFGVLDVVRHFKDGSVLVVSMVAWLSALIGHSLLQDIQAVTWNILFVFGPLLLGASSFGLPTARIWMMGLVEVSSWSISSAIIYRSIDTTLTRYLEEAAQVSLLSTEFISIINILLFLGLMPVVVPIVTGHLLGGSVVRGISSAVANSPVANSLASFVGARLGLSSAQTAGSGGSAPPARAAAQPSSSRRPGDV